MEEKCENCKYLDTRTEGREDEVSGGSCVIFLCKRLGDCVRMPQSLPKYRNDWCGEFEPKQAEGEEKENSNKLSYNGEAIDYTDINISEEEGFPLTDFSLKHHYGESFTTIKHWPSSLNMDMPIDKVYSSESLQTYYLNFCKQLRERGYGNDSTGT